MDWFLHLSPASITLSPGPRGSVASRYPSLSVFSPSRSSCSKLASAFPSNPFFLQGPHLKCSWPFLAPFHGLVPHSKVCPLGLLSIPPPVPPSCWPCPAPWSALFLPQPSLGTQPLSPPLIYIHRKAGDFWSCSDRTLPWFSGVLKKEAASQADHLKTLERGHVNHATILTPFTPHSSQKLMSNMLSYFQAFAYMVPSIWNALPICLLSRPGSDAHALSLSWGLGEVTAQYLGLW